MIHWRRAWLPALVAVFAIACQTQEPEQTGTTEEPVGDTETVRQSIESMNDRFEQALLAGDGAAVAELYSADAVLQPPSHPAVTGTQAIAEFWSEAVAQGAPTSVSLSTESVVVAESGDLAVEIGSFSVAGTAPDGTAWEEEGKYQVTRQNVDGEWRIIADTWNSDAPPPGAEGPAATEEAGAEVPASEVPETEAPAPETESPTGETAP